MTDFNYKKYSLEKLEEWMHDCMSSGEASPQEVYDTIVNVVKEQYNYYKDGASKTNELLELLNGVKTLHVDLSSLYGNDDNITFNTDAAGNYVEPYDYLACNKDDTSPECKGAWNSFWEEDQIKVDGYSVNNQSHSDYWYDYDRNDPNRPNPFKDKVVKWRLPIERKIEDGVDDYYIQFPDDLLEAANLKFGDEIEWVDRNDGTFILRKPNVIEANS